MRITSWVSGAGFFSMLAIPFAGFGLQPCIEPNAQKLHDVAVYVAAKHHITSADGLSLVTGESANEACFWRLVYAAPQNKRIAIYLSPDRRFLSDELFDLRVDPLLEEKKSAQAAMAAMLAGDPPTLGPQNAPVTIVEFSDFECPYCQRLKNVLEQDVLPKTSGKLRIVFRNYPLDMHPWAKSAAMMASCAALQDETGFWKVHDFIFDNQKTLSEVNLAQSVSAFVSSGTNLDKDQFNKCVSKDLSLGIVMKDMDIGTQNGVHSTPTAFVNGVRYEGVQNAAQLLSIVESVANGGVSSSIVSPDVTAVAGTKTSEALCLKPPQKRN